ncbi:MAG TPA: STAS domain-containing protein [Steroidobacteraceae bacterium]|nr:STAS domain-containing protein [Steroidobacteraceae bacterium]
MAEQTRPAWTLQQPAPGQFQLGGELTVTTATALRARALPEFAAAGKVLTVDLAGVTQVDSAGLALLIDWLAWAAAQHRSLRFGELPRQLRSLARLSEVEDLLVAPAPSSP